MPADHIFAKLSVWADLGSLLLLAASLLLGGLTPSRLVWGRSWPHNALLALVILLSFSWSVFRFVVEGLYATPGPREFLAANVVYLARWLYLWSQMNCAQSKHARMFAVATALRHLRTLRVGFSTDPAADGFRKGALEAVLRRGVRNPPHGETYWRGVKIAPDHFHEFCATWVVQLAEQQLHADKLDVFGTTEYVNGDQGSMNAAYRAFYDVVMTAVAFRPLRAGEGANAAVDGDGYFLLPQTDAAGAARGGEVEARRGVVNGSAEPNFARFFARWGGLPVEWVAQSVGAVDQRPIGFVARRVAADAVVLINNKGKGLNAVEQVAVINECLDRAVAAHLRRPYQAER